MARLRPLRLRNEPIRNQSTPNQHSLIRRVSLVTRICPYSSLFLPQSPTSASQPPCSQRPPRRYAFSKYRNTLCRSDALTPVQQTGVHAHLTPQLPLFHTHVCVCGGGGRRIRFAPRLKPPLCRCSLHTCHPTVSVAPSLISTSHFSNQSPHHTSPPSSNAHPIPSPTARPIRRASTRSTG